MSILQKLRQRNRSADGGLLGGLVTAGKYHDQRLAPLDAVHTLARPKVFAHLEHAFTYRLHVAQLGLAQPIVDALPGQPILRPLSQSENSLSSFTA
jgi:hypothetical protein